MGGVTVVPKTSLADALQATDTPNGWAYSPDDDVNPIASRRPPLTPFQQHVAEVGAIDPIKNPLAVLDSHAHFSGQQAEKNLRDEMAANAQRPWWFSPDALPLSTFKRGDDFSTLMSKLKTWLPTNDSVAARSFSTLAAALLAATGEVPPSIYPHTLAIMGPKQYIAGQVTPRVIKDFGPMLREQARVDASNAATAAAYGLNAHDATREGKPKPPSPLDYPMVF